MVITFPHFGNSALAIKAILDGIEVNYVMPDIPNRSCLELGSLYAPEEICLPFKIMLGGFMKSIEKGADTILIVGSCGPCRFGEYGELFKIIFDKLGFKLNYIVLDNPSEIGKLQFLKRVKKVSSKSLKSSKEKIKALNYGYKIIMLIDSIEQRLRYLAGYEVDKGQCIELLNKCKKEAYNCSNHIEMLKHLTTCEKLLNNIKIDKRKKPMKIAIIGEIYTIIEPFSNFHIEEKLMELGISTTRHLSASWFIKDAFAGIFKMDSFDMKKASKEYLPVQIGGYARQCIGEAVIASEKKYDGAIQIFPMGCMPEIVSKAILPKVSKDKNFPILSLVVDEMTGEAGYATRVEAFIDLLERRR